MQKFDTPAPVSAVLDVQAGRVQVIAADRTDTLVEVLPADPSRSRDVKLAEQTTVEYADGTLRITATATTRNRILGPSGSVEVTVRLPAGSRVEAKAAGAEFRGVGRLGEVAVDGSHGQVKIDEAAGARLAVLAGDVTVGRLTGPAEISTQQGDIRIDEAVRGTVTLHTQQGRISVGAARGTSATLDAGTSYGRIRNTLRNTDGAAADLTIHATTAHGDITARSL
ncbi:DUF4097 family beta strand repeat-containing protein [Streptomyces griseomycini]|uniref:DUF4097 domain-containing protein n=1 Tax=Streptomyces griseomycini TaxID=66895 RepID=A0A7W7PX92_9ACTN|nr:DUF4097 family beta strand repeat-containing protein [Streptomyces griseomycini]MBB4902990.1 hypothetical protein [Streptomyces griseomycini]GGQ36578.1 hypothetical protein GCM10010266_69870 [Streptomyces griseomycini]GGR50959.1 hypothetical protein GCM10015536_65700 [Streptomyces griseomycini]